ncbi:MAG: hypothetical protein B7Z73_11135 [Planctomycetia bacterium 21-64-5]|nr:MAG: hypothetical protein B7Z73_11135 [Planctomycetia bacterium 21-64-5]
MLGARGGCRAFGAGCAAGSGVTGAVCSATGEGPTGEGPTGEGPTGEGATGEGATGAVSAGPDASADVAPVRDGTPPVAPAWARADGGSKTAAASISSTHG